MRFKINQPYNDLPPLPPKEDVETKPILKKAIGATRALAELKGAMGLIPNPSMLINSLVIQEAKASSEIENIITTNDALFRAMAIGSGKIDPATKEVLRYRESLWRGFRKVKEGSRLDTALFIELVQSITKDNRGIRNRSGIVIGNPQTGEIIYTPPVGERRILKKLRELEAFLHTDSGLDPLIKLSLSHYQFEAIHPFFDGNGRTGRIINILYLIMNNLLDLPVLYLSKEIIADKPQYYKRLRMVTEKKEWVAWVLYMLELIERTASFTRDRIIDIRNLLDETLVYSRSKLPSRVYSKELIELIFRQPYTKGKFVVDAGLAERQTAAEYLKELERIGILELRKVGRENLYLNIKLYDLLSG